MVVKKEHHCAYEIHYHTVFPVKYRDDLLSREVEASLVRIGADIQNRYEIEINEIDGFQTILGYDEQCPSLRNTLTLPTVSTLQPIHR